MGSVRRYRSNIHPATVAVSLSLCTLRCRGYADKARAKGQATLADVYDGFILLLQEYAEDIGAGIEGRVLIDVVPF